MTYTVPVVKRNPEGNNERLGEYIFAEKPLIGDHLGLIVEHEFEMVEVLNYRYVGCKIDLDNDTPNTAEESIREHPMPVQLIVKSIDSDIF